MPSSRYIRPDWFTNRKGFRQRTDHRRAAENLNMSGGPEPGYTAVQISAGTAVVSRSVIDFYGEERLRAIVGDPKLEIIAAEDLL